MVLSLLLLFAGSLFAFSISAVCGGGASLVLLPVLGSVLPAAQVPAALSIGTVTSSISRLAVFRSSIRWDIVLWFVPPALPAVWLGAWLLKYVNPLYIELVMGILLVANLPQLFRPVSKVAAASPLSKGYLLLIGGVAGFISGLTGAVGLLFNRFYLRYGLGKEQIVATRAANELLLHGVKLVMYASFGLLTNRALLFGAVIAAAAMLSSWGMKWLLPKLSEQLFRRIGYGAMVVSGLTLLTGATSRLAIANQIQLDYAPISDGMETRMQWHRNLFTLEFEYDEGFEFEHRIAFTDLPISLQKRVNELKRGSTHVVLEEVFGVDKHYYEAYIYRGKTLQKVDL